MMVCADATQPGGFRAVFFGSSSPICLSGASVCDLGADSSQDGASRLGRK